MRTPRRRRPCSPGPRGAGSATPDLTPRLLPRPLSYPRSALCLTVTSHFLSLYEHAPTSGITSFREKACGQSLDLLTSVPITSPFP